MRTKTQVQYKQGALTESEKAFVALMRYNKSHYFTTLEICRITNKVSGRDVVRKIQAAGVPIGPAKLLYIGKSGNRVFGWRMV